MKLSLVLIFSLVLVGIKTAPGTLRQKRQNLINVATALQSAAATLNAILGSEPVVKMLNDLQINDDNILHSQSVEFLGADNNVQSQTYIAAQDGVLTGAEGLAVNLDGEQVVKTVDKTEININNNPGYNNVQGVDVLGSEIVNSETNVNVAPLVNSIKSGTNLVNKWFGF